MTRRTLLSFHCVPGRGKLLWPFIYLTYKVKTFSCSPYPYTTIYTQQSTTIHTPLLRVRHVLNLFAQSGPSLLEVAQLLIFYSKSNLFHSRITYVRENLCELCVASKVRQNDPIRDLLFIISPVSLVNV